MSYNILLVDDDIDFREEFREAFEDYRFVEAQSGAEALEVLARPNEIDLVILDVRLPDARGTRVLTEIKRLAPGLPVVILTGFSTKDVAVEALKGNADDYVEKPVDVEKTAGIIRRLLLDGKEPWPGADASAADKIERIKSYVDRNYDKTVGLEDAASLVCLSPKYLSRLFKERTGLGFNEYRLGRKIEHAKGLLEETGATVSQIAFRLGYQNAESFIRIFKKTTGLTPSAFRAGGAAAARSRAGAHGRPKSRRTRAARRRDR